MTENKQMSPIDQFRIELSKNYQKQVENYLGDQKNALRFMSGVIACMQKTPSLLQCDRLSVFSAFMEIAQLGLTPGVEAHVLPYKGKATRITDYKGLVELYYQAGIQSIRSDIIRENDSFSYENGKISHKVDIFSKNRGVPIGAWVIVKLPSGEELEKAMSKDEIMEIAKKSPSFNSSFSPWKNNDPQLWMWKKTVLKQLDKFIPKKGKLEDKLHKAIDDDYEKDERKNIDQRFYEIKEESNSLKMGNLIKIENNSIENEIKESMSEEEINKIFNEE